MVLPGGQREQLSQAAAFVLLEERLRSDAAETIAYFAAQGVALKVISGDSPLTVSAVVARAGMPHADRPVDARDLPGDPGALGRLLEERGCAAARSALNRLLPRMPHPRPISQLPRMRTADEAWTWPMGAAENGTCRAAGTVRPGFGGS